MSLIRSSYTGTIILNTREGYAECPAEFLIEGEEYPAEPYSWGGSRGMELEIGAELISAEFGGLILNRSIVEKIIGKEDLYEQEKDISEEYADAYQFEGAA